MVHKTTCDESAEPDIPCLMSVWWTLSWGSDRCTYQKKHLCLCHTWTIPLLFCLCLFICVCTSTSAQPHQGGNVKYNLKHFFNNSVRNQRPTVICHTVLLHIKHSFTAHCFHHITFSFPASPVLMSPICFFFLAYFSIAQVAQVDVFVLNLELIADFVLLVSPRKAKDSLKVGEVERKELSFGRVD